jgi:rhamnosyl/mannosyltransferase
MRAKKACVVTDVKGSGMSYVVEHLKTGLVVEHSSAEALAQALMHCADHPQHLIDWGNAGYERLQHMFSLPTIAAKVEDIYHQVLAPHDQSNENL